jgi:hypothetical protein
LLSRTAGSAATRRFVLILKPHRFLKATSHRFVFHSIVWGETVGLNTVKATKGASHVGPSFQTSNTIDQRLENVQVKQTVVNLLGLRDKTFKDTDALKKRYGLKKESVTSPFGRISLLGRSSDNLKAQDGTQLLWNEVFEQPAYASMQKAAQENKKSTSFSRKAKWAINDKTKFQGLVRDIREFNDNLFGLFPDIRTITRMKQEIDVSSDIRGLQLVQEAAAGEYEEISDTASVRLINASTLVLRSLPILSILDRTSPPRTRAFLRHLQWVRPRRMPTWQSHRWTRTW